MAQCLCHSQRVEFQCSMNSSKPLHANLGRTNGVIELDSALVDEAVSNTIRCRICREEALQTLEILAHVPILAVPLELQVDGNPILYALKCESVASRRKLVLSSIKDFTDIPAVAPSLLPDKVLNYLQEQANYGLFGKGSTDEHIDSVLTNLNGLSGGGILRDDQAMAVARHLDYFFDAVVVGYLYLRLYRAQNVPEDLVYVINSKRRDQADVFAQLIDQLISTSGVGDHSLSVVMPKLVLCFQDSLTVFRYPQVMEALRVGCRIFNASLPNSFVYRNMSGVHPLMLMTEFLLSIKGGKSIAVATPALSMDTMMMIRSFLAADEWPELELDAEILGHFSGGLLSPQFKRFMLPEEKLVTLFNIESGQGPPRLVNSGEVSSWFALSSIPDMSLESSARRFWTNRVSDYRAGIRGFLQQFMERGSISDQDDVWSSVRANVDAIFAVKIALHSYGELDFVLGRCHSVRTCKYPLERTVINRCLSHVVDSLAHAHGVVRPSPIRTSNIMRTRMGSGMDDYSLSTASGSFRGRMGSGMDEASQGSPGGVLRSRGEDSAYSSVAMISPMDDIGTSPQQRALMSQVIRASLDDYSLASDDEDTGSISSAQLMQQQYFLQQQQSQRWGRVTQVHDSANRRMSRSPTPSRMAGFVPVDGTQLSTTPLSFDRMSSSHFSPSMTDMKQFDDDWDFVGPGRGRKTVGIKKEPLTQFHETWTTKSCCIVRIPAAFYSFAVDSGALQAIAEKTGAHIEVLRMGKILVAASAFRLEALSREASLQAVDLFRDLLMNLGLCEKRFKVTKKVAARIVGKGGERIAVFRNKSGCKIFVSDVEDESDDARRMSWIILLGNAENVIEAHRMIRPYLVEQPFGPRGPRMNNPAAASWSSADDDDGHGRFAPSGVRTSAIRASFTSDGGDLEPAMSALSFDNYRSGEELDKRKQFVPTFGTIYGSGSPQQQPCPQSNQKVDVSQSSNFHIQSTTVRCKQDFGPLESVRTADDALFKAVQHREWSLAADLIARNEGINFVVGCEVSKLHLKTDDNNKAPSGTSVLHKAAERNAPENLIQALIDKGLDPNQSVAKKGFISLHYAVQSNSNAAVLQTLIKAGANVNHQDEQGFAPLHLAAQRNVSPRLAEILVQFGADLGLKDKTGATPVQVGKTSRAAPELLKLLQRPA